MVKMSALQVLLMNMVTTRVLHMVWSLPASNAEPLGARNARPQTLFMIKLSLLSQLAGTRGLPEWGVYTVD